MKKVIFILSLMLVPYVAQAENIKVILTKARNPIEGTVLSFSDTLVVMEPNAAPGQSIELTPERVQYFSIDGIGIYYSKGGKFVPNAKTKAKLDKAKLSKIEYEQGGHNLNEEIAKAFKSTGGICLGIGIPTLIAGSVLVGIGNSSTNGNGNISDMISETDMKSKCAIAGYIFMSTGATLTIIGVPLHIHGKHIADLNFNYTGNGAGVSLNF